MKSVKNYHFSKINYDKFYLYRGSLQDYSWKKGKKTIDDTKTLLRTHNFVERIKLWKYMGGLLSIIVDELNIKKQNKSVDQSYSKLQ